VVIKVVEVDPENPKVNNESRNRDEKVLKFILVIRGIKVFYTIVYYLT
jgi:hypothetical protein